MATRIPLTFSGNEITDPVRASGVAGPLVVGRAYDGRLNDGSTGIWEAITNLNPNGNAATDATRTGGSASVTRSRITTDGKFGSTCFKLTTAAEVADGYNYWHLANGGAEAGTGQGIAVTSGSTYTFHCWVKIPTALGGGTGGTKSVRLRLIEWNAAAGVVKDNNVAPNLLTTVGQSFDWVHVSYTITMQATTTNVTLRVNVDFAIGDVLVGGVMLNSGSVAGPYVHTDGALATHAASAVRMPSSLLNPTQGWVVARVRSGWPSSVAFTGAAGNPGRYFEWGAFVGVAPFHFIQLFPATSLDGRLQFNRGGVSASVTASDAVAPWNTGDALTVAAAWTATDIGVARNGAAFTRVAAGAPTIPDMSAYPLAYIGGGGSTPAIDSDVFWFICGTGTLSDADFRYLSTLLDPSLVSLPASAGAVAYWDGVSTSMVSLVPTTNYSAGGGSGPAVSVELDLSGNGPVGTPTWTDASGRVLNGTISIQRGRANFLDRIEVGSAQVQLDNSDRAFEPEYAASPYYPNITARVGLRVSAVYASTIYRLHRGFVDGWPITWPSVKRSYAPVTSNDAFAYLSGVRVTPQVFAQALSGSQIGTFLDQAAWPAGLRSLDAGAETLLGIDATVNFSDPPDVLSLVQDSADSELGLFFIDGSGTAIFHDRDHRIGTTRSTTVQATFSDDPNTGLPYLLPSPDFGIERVWNDVRVTSGIGGALPQIATASTSIAKYGQRTLARSTRLNSNATASDQASRILVASQDPHLRFPTLTLDPTRDARLWPVVLGLEISDRVVVLRTPYAGGATISKTCYVEAIRHDIAYSPERVDWKTTLSLSLADPGFFLRLDDATLGRLDFNSLR